MTWLLGIGRWLLFSKYGRYTLLAIAIVTAGVIYRHKLIEVGKSFGKEEQRTEQVQGIKQGLDQDRTATTQIDHAIEARIAAAETRAANAEARARQAYAAAQNSKQSEQQAVTPESKLDACQGQAAQLETAYHAKDEQVSELITKFNEAVNRYENKAAYAVRLEGRFVELWNSNPPKKKCWHKWLCGKDRLKPPPLDEIKKQAAQDVVQPAVTAPLPE